MPVEEETKVEPSPDEANLKLEHIPQDKVDGLHSVAAVMENRAHEVGIAVYTPELSKVTLTQLVDTSLYQHTQAFLRMNEVQTIVFSQSLVGTALYLVLQANQNDHRLFLLQRSFFSEQKGGNLILALSVKHDKEFESILKSKYVACASLNALSAFLERSFNL
jgi:hypothetical protein